MKSCLHHIINTFIHIDCIDPEILILYYSVRDELSPLRLETFKFKFLKFIFGNGKILAMVLQFKLYCLDVTSRELFSVSSSVLP